jgi:predicted ribosome quality control (RQC) complex YloA/Tae2 family protein
MKEKKSISNLDLYVLAMEMNEILADGYVHNVYELEDKDKLKIRFRSKTGKQDLVVDPKTRVSLTNYDYPVPPFPSQFITTLRKKINKLRVKRVYQYNMDRILIIEMQNLEGNTINFIIELFGSGNYILTDPNGLVFLAKSYKQMKDRIIQPKRPYEFPPTKGLDYLNLEWESYIKAFDEAQAQDNGKTDAVRFISMNFNIGGYIAEEICTIADVFKNKIGRASCRERV